MSKRLKVCPDEECVIILQMGGHDEWVEQGGSVFCCGKLPAQDMQQFKQVLHVNDYAFCIYSPKKGMVDFLINANDAFIMQTQMGAILKNYREGLK